MKIGARQILLVLILLVTVAGLFPRQAHADYENDHINTGNYREDLIAVAMTQLGYMEGSGEYTKYGQWYGGSYMSTQPWCAMFISWCANQAGIPTSILDRASFATPDDFEIPYYAGTEYTPKRGDLCFKAGFKHVGIVIEVDTARGVVKTIDGNTWPYNGAPHGVYITTRSISASYFGVPEYGDGQSTHTHSYRDAKYETAHPHKEYKQCKSCTYKHYTGATKTVAGCQSCCTHTFGGWGNSSASQHRRTCSKCGYKETKNHSWGSMTTTREATCKEPGLKKQVCSTCKAEKTAEIPKLPKHSFSQWETVDEKTHSRQCAVCEEVETAEHTALETWETDGENHWKTCTDCQSQILLEAHTELTYCDTSCEICLYVRPQEHIFEETLSWDIEGHFYACQLCPFQNEDTPHTLSQDWSKTEQLHYTLCTVCGYRHNPQPHVVTGPPTEEQAQLCAVCHWQCAPQAPHIHNYYPMEYSWEKHWGVCRCGQEYEAEKHIWLEETGLCSVCDQPYMEKPITNPLEWVQDKAEKVRAFLLTKENDYLLYWIAGGWAVLTVGAVVLIICLARKGKKTKKKDPQPVG